MVNLVLNTDIASPERTQLAKSKFKEAFGSSSGGHGGSVSSVISRSSSVASDGEEDDDDKANSSGDDGDDMLKHARKWSLEEPKPPNKQHHGGRSMSAPTPLSFRKRLGIRRSMDLSGEALEAFASHADGLRGAPDDDDADELKAAVVMETVMTCADVAHNLQGWEQMCIWSSRLYGELRKAHVEGRGVDVSGKWFENQIGFLESYLLPLARQLDSTGVFGSSSHMDNEYPEDGVSSGRRRQFADIVASSRDRWLLDGMDVAEETIRKGNEAFPLKNNG